MKIQVVKKATVNAKPPATATGFVDDVTPLHEEARLDAWRAHLTPAARRCASNHRRGWLV